MANWVFMALIVPIMLFSGLPSSVFRWLVACSFGLYTLVVIATAWDRRHTTRQPQ